jgi:putative membrane protein
MVLMTLTNIIKITKPKPSMKTLSITLFSSATLAMCGLLFLGSQSRAEDNKSGLTSDEVTFIKHAAADGLAEVKIAGLAVRKAESAGVKALAETLVTDHTKVNEELTLLATNKSVDLSAVIDPKDAGIFQKLEKYSGAEFDKAYLSEVVSSHKKCLGIFEEISKESKNAEVKAFADKYIPTLKAHHDKAKEMHSK